MEEPAPICDFSQGLGQPIFVDVDDRVMGGRSVSGWTHDAEHGAAAFSGDLVVEGGGFASVRSLPWDGWSKVPPNSRGLQLLVKGDGRRYKLNAKVDDGWDGVTWQHDFETAAGADWQKVDLHYGNFVPTFRGRVVTGAPPLPANSVRQVGFMLSKLTDRGATVPNFAPGRFRLLVKWVRPLLVPM